ncbi:hypothetical protein H310_05340 [Aphanomyces invadans]|uniref:C2 domain-containing protein n=1 Tax=Aphanomyces invadans TaxID=157072 RepID=A0A024UB69_9STRA|nr:hypothetical protein H310_05340 [Aphanomyces invadans]ETW02868.1 hypothetical protein H310_05340 [Aphanomyces invadans]|eukprot:XP_008868252.1 hypothetical protein H310_05340 [Aphanomyces invadans]
MGSTTDPAWEDATFAFDVSTKTHLRIHVQLVGSKRLMKRDLGHFDLNLSEHRLAKEGTHSLSCHLLDGCGGVVNVSMSIFREPHPIRDWARREVAGAAGHRLPCHSLLECVPSWSTREELFKNACGPCFLALVESHSVCDASFTAKGLKSASALHEMSTSTTGSHTTNSADLVPFHDGHFHMKSAPPLIHPNHPTPLESSLFGATAVDDTPPCPSIQEWMQARHPNESFVSKSIETASPSSCPLHTSHPTLLQLMWLLPLLSIVVHQWLILVVESRDAT